MLLMAELGFVFCFYFVFGGEYAKIRHYNLSSGISLIDLKFNIYLLLQSLGRREVSIISNIYIYSYRDKMFSQD